MAAQGHESTHRKTRLVVGTYLVLAAAPFIVAATTAAYWRHAEPATVTVLIAVVLISLVRRHRWAWVVLVVIEGVVLISFAFDFTKAFLFIADLASFALLVSPPMRRYVRPRH
jgi:drug/metabolite transporter (DMT)-like permease